MEFSLNPIHLAGLALLLEALIPWPRTWPHPVMAVGKLISTLASRWNNPAVSRSRRKLLGIVSMLLLIGLCIAVGTALTRLAQYLPHWLGSGLILLMGMTGMAAGSLWQHVQAVAKPLTLGQIETSRQAVSMIVGRDTHDMSQSDIANAAIESLAESFNDGVVAPVFWFVVAGLPGLFAYKTINTADSMIGHMEEPWRDFGWAAARLDDLMNLIPARLAGGLVAAAGLLRFGTFSGWNIMLRHASRHRSPNSGWPEAAMAGSLKIQLGGPVRYDGQVAERPILGHGPLPLASDLSRALSLYRLACLSLFLLLVFLGLIWPR